jgi:hypothetical protein
MITIAIESPTTLIANETFQVKSIAAAWNKLREIRDSINPANLIGTVARISTDDPNADMSRIPAKIMFLPNKAGKMEFRDVAKIQSRSVKKKSTRRQSAKDISRVLSKIMFG